MGMTVVDAEGNIVGTVKYVSFTIGKAGISMSVEDKAGAIQDIPWDSIQGAGDFVILKPAVAKPSITAQPAQAAQPAQSTCPSCRGPLSYIQQYQRWYCYKCQKYV